jgi:alcohol dehydrogenase (NADP+)
MIPVRALAADGPHEAFRQTVIQRRDLGPRDVLIDIAFAGICHTDVHHTRAEFGHTTYPIVPGHEIVGVVSAAGREVTQFRVGDRAGIGCLVDSCRQCENCRAGQESYCRGGKVLTYNALGKDGLTTLGGYSEKIVVDEHFAVRVPEEIPLEGAAPLLCGGITMYQPLRRWGAGPGKRVAIVGFGGLGHVGTQISKALGAHTTVLNLTAQQNEDARRLGADDYRVTTEPETFKELADAFDLIVSTVPVSMDVNAYLELLTFGGTLVNLGVPEEPLRVDSYTLLTNRRSIAGSMSGGIPETQEMLDFCARHGIAAQTELVNASQVDEAYDRLARGDVRYRFVIDIRTLSDA